MNAKTQPSVIGRASNVSSHAATKQGETATRAGFEARLCDAGVSLIECNADGEVVHDGEKSGIAASSDWFAAMLHGSRMVRTQLKAAAQKWKANSQATLAPLQMMPGLWVAPMPRINRRRCVGYTVAVIPTIEFINSEQFVALCQSASPQGADLETCRKRLSEQISCGRAQHNATDHNDKSPGEAIPQITSLIATIHEQRAAMSEMQDALHSTSQQLAETYEEIQLLYSITHSMTMQQGPERFITQTCNELLATLPYAWIGVQLGNDRSKLKDVAGRFIVSGRHEMPIASMRALIQTLVAASNTASPVVLEPAKNSSHARFAGLGRTVLLHPVVRESKSDASMKSAGKPAPLGYILAGEKNGPDTAVSNIDIKLLGAAASHVAIFLENAALYDDLSAMFLGTLDALTASIDAKDRYTCGHSRRVAHLTQALAHAIKLDEYTVSRCHIAGLVHDVGKIGVPESVLTKPGKLTEEEFAWIRRHPEIGHRILVAVPQLQDILPGVLHHHERWDGAGYPHRLRGEAIPLVARLIGLADSFDAMSSNRTYRSALNRQQVLSEIEKCAGTQFDPDLAHAFIKLDFSAYDRMSAEDAAMNNDRGMNLCDRTAGAPTTHRSFREKAA